ncbi:MAG: IclR family transcriptional regulator C-terminal domain-containing protein [Rubripirellula sp.]|nr:IclR family transcriptional regulator C-terminal domain-containing protein [Rubripirellula sp.]
MPDSADSLLFRSGDPNFMTSLARGLGVLRAFADSDGELTVREICENTGLSRAVVRRCLYTLVEAGYVRHDDRRYQLDVKVLSLAKPYYSASRSLPALAQPFLDSLSQEIEESCSLAVLDGDDVVYVARAATKRIMTVSLNLGSRLPSSCTSLGRVLLSGMSNEALEAFLSRNPLVAHTAKSITSTHEWRDFIRQVKEQAYALVDEELEVGLRSVAVPVHGADGGIVAAMNVGVQATRISAQELKTRILPKLRTAASMLSNQISSAI